jgi:uncharacterized protein YydD (DUF2326 family)
VVFAKSYNPEFLKRDSHNLGKTFLIEVIDFCLLGTVDKTHPFRVHEERFEDFTFFLEIESIENSYVTVRRQVTGRNVIDITTSKTQHQDQRQLPREEWEHSKLSQRKGREVLNQLLDLSALEPYDYRKGLGYVMRRQQDYDKIFRISKFQYGADKYWKPFVAKIIGLDDSVVEKKYELDDRISELEKELEILEDEAGSKSEEYDEIKGEIELRSNNIKQLKDKLESFSFRDLEEDISENLVNDIEEQISELNERRYTIDYELKAIEDSLDHEYEFDLERLRRIYEEVKLVLPDQLVRGYEELVAFNERLSEGRRERLLELRDRLQEERERVQNRIENLDIRRSEALETLQEKETIEKFQQLQSRVLEREKELLELEQRLEQLDVATGKQSEINEAERELAQVVTEVQQSVRNASETYRDLRKSFSSYVKELTDVQALLSVSVNQYGNLDFNVRTLDPDKAGRETSEWKGTSYRKLLAACFDLALLKVHSDDHFYRYVYHDGIFEGLDNRKKVNLLSLVRNACHSEGIQYILTVIDTDLPRDERDDKLLFSKDEIVRELHDKGDSGRLFRMSPF